MIGFFLALHDIWRDYASPAIWAHAGQPIPDRYSPYHRTPGEWGMMQVGFVVIAIFHVLLFARESSGSRSARQSDLSALPVDREFGAGRRVRPT